MIIRQGPWDSVEFAEGFVHGVEYLASYAEDIRGPLPQVVGKPVQVDGRWYVDVEIDDDRPVERDQWIVAFCSEYLRRTGITVQDGGQSPEEVADRYWPGTCPVDAVLHQIEKYDLDDITMQAW